MLFVFLFLVHLPHHGFVLPGGNSCAVVQLGLGSLCHPWLRSFIHDAKSCYMDSVSLWLKSGDMSHTGFEYGPKCDGDGGVMVECVGG